MKVPILCLAALGGGCASVGSNALVSSDPIPVEVWTGGDDGLTQRVRDAVEEGFARSPRFKLVDGGTPNALRVMIPTHVEGTEMSGRTRVTYQLRLERDGRRLRDTQGVCWEEQISKCGEQVVRAAIKAVAP